MKKKVVAAILVTVLSLSAFTGCGKSETEKMADQLQKDYGMSEEEAQFAAEVAQEIAGEADENQAEQEELSPEEQRIASFKLVEPKKEIIDSKLGDQFIQLENEIIPIDGSITVSQLMDIVQGCYDFPLSADIEGSFGAKTEVTPDALVSRSVNPVDRFVIKDDFGDDVIDVYYSLTNTDGPVKLYDLPVRWISSGVSVYSLNFFYPGNICPATYRTPNDCDETEIYNSRISQYPPLKYDEVGEFIEKQGLKYKFITGANDFETKFISGAPMPDTDDTYYLEVGCTFGVDMGTATADRISFSQTYGKENTLRFVYNSPEEMEDEDLKQMLEEVEKDVLEVSGAGAASAEMIGYKAGSFFDLVFMTDKNEYLVIDACSAHKTYGGKFEFSHTSLAYTTICGSIDELMEKRYESRDEYTWLED